LRLPVLKVHAQPARFALALQEVSFLMSLDEFKYLLIVIGFLFVHVYILGHDPRRVARIFFLSSGMGFIAQLMLGKDLNLYTPNITLYIAYVSIAVITTWGIALTTLWAIHTWLARILKISPGVGTYALCGIPLLITVECIGSNVIKMKLHNYTQYAALMPYINSMNAPKWLYAYYIILALIFFYSLNALGIYSENRQAFMPQANPFMATCNDESED
jgi:hypothetical protein